MPLRARAWIVLTAFAMLLGAASCSDGEKAGTASSECNPQRVTECPSPAPVYADVAPIFQRVCANCHSTPGGPWPLDEYSHIADWQDVIRDELLTCAMPPADSAVPLPDADRQLILTWIRCGYPKE